MAPATALATTQPVTASGLQFGADTARILGALAPATQRAYQGHWRRFRAWAEDRGLRGADDRVLADYIANLRESGAAPGTCHQAAAAVRKVAGLLGCPMAGELTKAELKRAGRENAGRGRGQAPGVRWASADTAARIAETRPDPRRPWPGKTRGLRDAALIAVMSDGLLRGQRGRRARRGRRAEDARRKRQAQRPPLEDRQGPRTAGRPISSSVPKRCASRRCSG